MKKINFEIIKKVDYVLVLVVALFAIISFSVESISKLIPRKKSSPAKITIVDSDDEKEPAETKETTDFLRKVDDVYVFSVSTSAIKSDDLPSSTDYLIPQMSNSIGQMRSSSSQIINLIFVKDGEETSLFSSKAYIYKFQLKNSVELYTESSSIYSYDLVDHDFNIYAVIKNDTNNDKALDSKDNISLYVSDYDGKNLKELSSSIYYFECTANNTCLFSEYHDGKVSFYEYDGNLKKVNLIRTFEQELTEKRIELW